MDDATVYGFHFVDSPGAVPGDYSDDENVAAADYVVWRKFINTPSTYDIWRQHFGEAELNGASANIAVPEPATIGITILAVIGFVATRRNEFATLP